MHVPTQGQWWSKRSTQLSHVAQCFDRGGRGTAQVAHHWGISQAVSPSASLKKYGRPVSSSWNLRQPGGSSGA